MKFYLSLFLISVVVTCSAQTFQKRKCNQNFKNCKNRESQIKESFLNAEYYLEEDDILASQKWLDVTKSLISLKKIDTTTVFVYSLQSELFYYKGLHQFGINEAEKAATNAHLLKDSLLISNAYFFKGINLVELDDLNEAQLFLWKSREYQPKNSKKTYLRSAILNEHIFNNLAQIKQQLKQPDSAILYNKNAYYYAKKNNSKRGIPNIEQTYGLIFLNNKMIDDAIFYFKKSIESAKKSNYNDIVLSDYGYLIHCFPNDLAASNNWFNNGLALIKQKKINISYQAYFFETAIKAFDKNNQSQNLIFAQEQLLKINNRISLDNNNYIQTFAKQYLKNENKLLKQELRLIKSSKEKQIFYLVVTVLALISIGIWYFFKQKQRLKNQEIETLKQNQDIAKLEALIDGEEKERRRIALELHDGLNGDLAAIKYRLSTLEESVLDATDAENLTKVITMIDESCTQIRSISHNLMPSSIIDYGLIETIKEYCLKIKTTNQFKIDFQSFGNYIALSKKSETVIYRIIQELISNILKHSKATEAMIQFNYRTDELFITVEDNGIGFDVNAKTKGIGHENIKTRIDFLNAQLNVDSSSAGTSYTISIDLNKVK